MTVKTYIFIFLLTCLFGGSLLAEPDEKSSASREYKIKAAFIYNFLKTVEWPKEFISDSNESMVVGIIGKDPFGDAFEPIIGKVVKGKKVVVTRLKGLSQIDKRSDNSDSRSEIDIETMRKCHLLFVCSSEQRTFMEIIKSVDGYSVLTVGEIKNFLEAGGVINFIPQAEKGDFEINLSASKRAKLNISSKLLRIAKRVIEEESSGKETG
ncbi:MAG: hypothetical protein A2167_01770 [Planctomycetes bacterium RBG_13_46_10]|nr:MAG: hypothetical protein A2167_01770 [Planctomycetes bacterium RBG_13_46_10]QBM02876.1 hypothetical protein [uncultured archaeon]